MVFTDSVEPSLLEILTGERIIEPNAELPLAKKMTNQNGRGRLDESVANLNQSQANLNQALAALAQAQATLTQTQATLTQTQATFAQNQAAFLSRMAEIDRSTSERFTRIEHDMTAIMRVLAEHSRLLERLPEAVRDKIGFKGP